MRLRVPRSALVGLGLMALGASSYSGIELWMSTRIVRPVHMPISFAAGHIRTGSFRLNLKTNYWVVVNPGEWWTADRQCDLYAQLRTRWVLYQDGKVVDRQDEATSYSTS